MFRMIQLALRTPAALDASRASGRSSSRRAFTLLELMIATAITLLMMISLVQVFKTVGDSMKQGRAVLQLNNTLRSATFRLRNDLNNLTLRVDPPADLSTGSGYLEYFDGSMTDYTCALFDELSSVDARLTSSRFGDMDDILMFTARAGGDTWFVGQVPNFVLNPALLGTPGQDTDSDGTPDAIEMVTINSQLAEIVVFARPVTTGSTLFDDADGNHLPDAYQLYYRTLLIRPDLNTATFNSTPSLPNTASVPSLGQWLIAGTASGAPGPLDMVAAHQQCDLSIRRVYDGATGVDSVAANSLEDLMNPANRFAHFEYPVSSVFSGSVSSTMPLLVLQPIPRSGSGAAGTCINVFGDDGNPSTVSPLYSDPNPGSMPAGLSGAAGNFLHPSFTLMATRRGEDVLATDCMGFDVKIFDSGVPVIGLVGADGIVGTGSSGSAVLGADGSDDLILTPNDPGYAPALTSSTAPAVVSYGAYVDLMWGRKTLASLPAFPPGSLTVATVFGNQPAVNLWTEFSGLAQPASIPSGSAPQLPLVDGLLRSGKALVFPGVDPPVFLQPTFDTWSTYYERDGNLQAELTGPTVYGVVNVDQFKRMAAKAAGSSDKGKAKITFRKTDIDAGIDGIDNDQSGGADEAAELETSAPFPVRPTGLKVSIRVGDRASRQVKQMSVATEFVTQ